MWTTIKPLFQRATYTIQYKPYSFTIPACEWNGLTKGKEFAIFVSSDVEVGVFIFGYNTSTEIITTITKTDKASRKELDSFSCIIQAADLKAAIE